MLRIDRLRISVVDFVRSIGRGYSTANEGLLRVWATNDFLPAGVMQQNESSPTKKSGKLTHDQPAGGYASASSSHMVQTSLREGEPTCVNINVDDGGFVLLGSGSGVSGPSGREKPRTPGKLVVHLMESG